MHVCFIPNFLALTLPVKCKSRHIEQSGSPYVPNTKQKQRNPTDRSIKLRQRHRAMINFILRKNNMVIMQSG